MGRYRWKRTVAAVLAAGLLLSQGGYAFAAEADGMEEALAETGAAGITAPDGTGAWTAVSDAVYAMLEEGTVYQDSATGYLVRSEDGCRIHPVTGEILPETGETQPDSPDTEAGSEETQPEEPGTDLSGPDSEAGEAQKPEGDGTENEPAEGEDPAEPGEAQDPDDPEPGEGTEDPAEPEDPEEGAGEAGTESPPAEEEPQAPSQEQGTPDEEDAEEDGEGAGGRDALVRGAQIVETPVVVEDFRFWTVARKYGFAKKDIYIRESMPEQTTALTETVKNRKSESAIQNLSSISLAKGLTESKVSADLVQISEGVRAIGYLKEGGLLYILKEEENGWLYVESGAVRGFVKAEEILTGEDAQGLLEEYQKEAKERAQAMGQEYSGIESAAPIAEALVSLADNRAYTYLRATAGQTVIAKEYALVNVPELNVREGKGEEFDIVGTMEEGALCYIIADKADDWIYIESGDVRGFVDGEYLDYGEEVTVQVETAGEESFAVAEPTVTPEENSSLYYTLTSVKSGVPGGEVRSSLLEFASQFIGNPYVWGGTSLTDGADCSGFVQSIFREYGYELPRVAADQAYAGTQIAVEDALPGDLVFYADGSGHIYHVVIYAGDGKTIEAQSSATGIVRGVLDTADAVWAVRLLEDTMYTCTAGSISEVNATDSMYGESLGTFRLTYYCACELCCDVETGITATGTPVVEGRTIAVDPSVIPYGTQVIINGHVFTAEDCGGAIDGNRIDIYVNDHQTALELGVGQAEVYLVK